MSRAERKAQYMEAAGEMYDEMEGWYDEHEEASFGEIEQALRQRRRRLMGKALAVLVNGRDVGVKAEKPACPACGETMVLVGYRRWGVSGLEGDTELERAYYRCPAGCGESFFPPR